MLNFLKKEANKTYTENGAVTLRSTRSDVLDLFAKIGALRNADDSDIIARFIKAYAENPDLAMKTLFFARDIRGGLGERRVFKTILGYLAVNEPESVRKNIENIAEYGRYDDLLVLMGTPCEKETIAYIGKALAMDLASLEADGNVSLLAKWLPSVNTSNKAAVRNARKIARGIGMTEGQYRKALSALRAQIKIIENNLREKDYSFDYEHQPSKALFKYRRAFLRNDEARYLEFMDRAKADPSVMHTGTLTPSDVIAPIVNDYYGKRVFSENERLAMDTTWNALENYVGAENALAVVDGSGSMYTWETPSPAAVAQSLGIYFAERNTGAFHNHFITFSNSPQLVEVKGRDIYEKVRYCMSYNECSNTDIEKTFMLILRTAVANRLTQKDLPEIIYIISDMEFDYCAANSSVTNFENAKKLFEDHGYKLPKLVFWNVNSRNVQQPVKMNEQGVVLVSGSSPQLFSMIKENNLNPYNFMMSILSSARYERIAA